MRAIISFGVWEIAMELYESHTKEAAAILRDAGFGTTCFWDNVLGQGWLDILKATKTQFVRFVGSREIKLGFTVAGK